MVYYKCTYADYGTLPDILYTGHTTGMELKTVDGTKFMVRDTETPGQGILSWMTGSEPSFTNEEAKEEVRSAEWIDLPSEVMSLEVVNSYHIMTMGASNSGGYNADPSLTSTPMDGVYTLTDGPLSPDTTGDLIPLIEGNEYNQDVNPAKVYANVESQASGIGHQLKSLLNNDDEVVVTIHYRGGTSIQELSDGGAHSNLGYDQLVATSNRVKEIADSQDKNYIPIVLLYASGSGANPFETGLTNAITSIRSGLSSNYSGEIQFLINQPRVTGNPDLGPQVYDVVKNISGVHLSQPMKTAIDGSKIQGDGIHYTNHGQRHSGIYNAYAIYDIIQSGSSFPLDLDLDNIVYDQGTTKMTIPVTGMNGSIEVDTDLGIEVYDADSDNVIGGFWLPVGNNIEFLAFTNVPTGVTNIEIRTDVGTGYLKDSRSNSGVIFNDSDSNPYSIENFLARYNHQVVIDFGGPSVTTYKVNLDANSNSYTDNGWQTFTLPTDNSLESTPQTFDLGGIDLYKPVDGWGAGTSGPSGWTGDPHVPDEVLDTYWAAQGNPNNWLELRNLNPTKQYNIRVVTARVNGGNTNRTHNYTFDGLTQVIVSGVNASNNKNTFAESGNIYPDLSGNIRITDDPIGDTFYRINAIIVEEF